MGTLWAELGRAIARLNFLFAAHREMRQEIAFLQQQLRDLRGR